MSSTHFILDKRNSVDLIDEGSFRRVNLHTEGHVSWKAFGDGVKVLTVEKNMARGHLHIELEETDRDTGGHKKTMLSLNKEVAETLLPMLNNFLGDK